MVKTRVPRWHDITTTIARFFNDVHHLKCGTSGWAPTAQLLEQHVVVTLIRPNPLLLEMVRDEERHVERLLKV